MTHPSSEYPTELERKTKNYLELVRRIDAILAEPVKTLIRITDEYIRDAEQPNSKPVGFPVWMSDYLQPEPEDDLFSKAICFATLQEIWKLRRRFSWLPPKPDSERLERLLKSKEGTRNQLINNVLPSNDDFSECIKSLSSRTFGALNPFTASQVFQVLISDSERQAHGALGFLAFFAMIWPLYRTFPDPQGFGAAIEPWERKAFVTAKCILPIKTLQDICTERADLMNKIVDILERMKESADKDKEGYDPHQRWLFNVELDNLRARLSRLSSIVVAKEKLRNRSNQVREFSDGLSQNSGSSLVSQSIETSYNNILERAANAIKEIGKGGVEVFKEARNILNEVDKKVITKLKNPSQTNLEYLTRKLKPGLKFAREYAEHPIKEVRINYFKDLHTAALKSLKFCSDALEILNRKYSLCKDVTSNLGSIKDIASQLAAANKQVAEMMDDLVRNATIWCRAVADREIAHASAQNLTDFDPSELVSAIAVAVRWNQMTTTLQVSDAVGKALAGMRTDGSWSAGQPFYSPNNAVGIWPITSDIVLTLTEVLEEHREVDVADTALFRYVDWLERTRTELNFPSNQKDKKTDELAVGWASDRFRHRGKIHFPTTAFSVNALLKIRDLVEYRLWQLCEQRFTVIKSHERSELKKVAPVDLGAQHKYRLHRRIAERQSNYEDAEYSFVLHGPPGSSKTSIAEALSVEQWKATRPWGSKETPRLVRITPADFTRMGEDRLDSEARLIFDLLSGIRGVTILFDEIDDLLRQRNAGTGPLASKPTFMELVVPAMLNRLADLREACPRQELCFVLATNFIESIEPALLRKGRIDRLIPVVYPDQESRLALIYEFTTKLITAIEGKLKFEKTEISACIVNRSKELCGWPYQSIKAACRQVERELSNALGQMSSEAAIRLSLDERRKQFRSVAKDIISKVIDEYGSSISSPRYEERLAPPFRQELLNEYAHFIIAGCEDGQGLESWFNGHYAGMEFKKRLSEAGHDQAINKLKKAQPLYKKIRAVLDDEKRWTEDKTVRGMLAEAAALPLP